MSKAVVRTIFSLVLTACIVSMFFISYLSKNRRHEIVCNSLKIEFTDSLKFIDEDNVRTHLDRNYGTYIGQRLDSVNLNRIEELFKERNSVTSAQAWTTDDGTLHLCISQRLPVLRFMNGDKGFYCDNTGFIFPLHKTFVADVPVIEGVIPIVEKASYNGYPTKEEDRLWLLEMIKWSEMLQNNKTIASLIEHIYIQENKDIALQMKSGKELFIFGDISDFKTKLKLVDKYYKSIAPIKEYKTVNLKYKKQIICRTDI